MYKILKPIISIICILLTATSFAQNVVIDYSTWVWSTDPNAPPPPCNIFGSAINVPATINGSSGTVEHQTQIGQPAWTTTNKYVEMACTYVSSSSSLGTKYRINYTFKVGAKYIITVNAAAKTGSTNGTGPYLRLDLTSAGGGGSTGCNGPGSIDPTTSGNPAAQQLNSTTYSDIQFAWATALTTASPTLEVSSIPAINGGTNAIRIKKITIAETISGSSFTLSPASVSKACGTALTQTFTVNNVNNTPGVTGYVWNLGTATNGWTYNGNPAPQTISTSTNTLILTAAACVSALQNVTATANIGSTGYNTNASVVSISNPALSISGLDNLCTATGTYNIPNLPCNAVVTWSASPVGIVTLSPTTGPQTTLTKTTSGAITLTATIGNSCGLTNPVKTKPITVGSVAPITSLTENKVNNGCVTETSTYTVVGGAGATNYKWYVKKSPSTTFTLMLDGASNSFAYTLPNKGTTCTDYTVKVEATNGCNPTSPVVYSLASQTCPCGFAAPAEVSNYTLAVTPNPANSVAKLTLIPSANKAKDASGYISRVNIMDKFGNLKKQHTFKNKQLTQTIDLSSLPPDEYIINVFNGEAWQSVKVIVL